MSFANRQSKRLGSVRMLHDSIAQAIQRKYDKWLRSATVKWLLAESGCFQRISDIFGLLDWAEGVSWDNWRNWIIGTVKLVRWNLGAQEKKKKKKEDSSQREAPSCKWQLNWTAAVVNFLINWNNEQSRIEWMHNHWVPKKCMAKYWRHSFDLNNLKFSGFRPWRRSNITSKWNWPIGPVQQANIHHLFCLVVSRIAHHDYFQLHRV